MPKPETFPRETETHPQPEVPKRTIEEPVSNPKEQEEALRMAHEVAERLAAQMPTTEEVVNPVNDKVSETQAEFLKALQDPKWKEPLQTTGSFTEQFEQTMAARERSGKSTATVAAIDFGLVTFGVGLVGYGMNGPALIALAAKFAPFLVPQLVPGLLMIGTAVVVGIAIHKWLRSYQKKQDRALREHAATLQ